MNDLYLRSEVVSRSCQPLFTEQDGSSLPSCRSAPFVWYAVQTTSEIVTHWVTSSMSASPSVQLLETASFRCGWCSTMEQLVGYMTSSRVTRHISVVDSNHSILFYFFTLLWSLRFLADRTNGRAYATYVASVCRLSSVCLWRYVLWLNGES